MKTRITDILDRRGVGYTIKKHAEPVYTSEDAARERGVELSQIVKTMLLVSPGGETMLAVIPGHKRLNIKAIKKMTGHKDIRFMDREGMERLGLTVGAISPIDEVFRDLPTFMDPELLDHETVDISSGHPEAGLEIRSRSLRELLSHATITPVTK
jgi:Ala-tRNA(Pro) deacylase